MKAIYLIFTVFLSFLSGVANARNLSQKEKKFSYRIYIPETKNTCLQDAEKLGFRFNEVTNQTVIESKCDRVIELEGGNKLHAITVSYLATEEYRPYSFVLGRGFMDIPSEKAGVFNTFQDCVANLGLYTGLYESMTGLKMVAGTCTESNFMQEKKYALRLDGFSKEARSVPSKRLFAITPDFAGLANENIFADFERLTANSGAQGTFRIGTTVFYFNEYPNSIRNGLVGYFSRSECESQLAEVKNIYTNAGSKNTFAYCLPNENPDVESVSLEFIAQLIVFPSQYTVDSEYYSFEDCMSDKTRVLEQAISRGENPMGAICQPGWDNYYQMQLYKKLN